MMQALIFVFSADNIFKFLYDFLSGFEKLGFVSYVDCEF